MAYDSGRGRTIMFGGATGSGAAQDLSDTWEWDGTDWTRINTKNSPKPRRNPMLTYHLTGGKALLFGGGTGSSGPPFFGDTWTYDGRDWTQLSPKNSPTARWGGAFTPLLVVWALNYMSWREAFVLFGSIGVVWVVVFFVWFRDNPRDHASVNSRELDLLQGSEANASGHGDVP